MDKPQSTSKQADKSALKTVINSLLDRLYPRLDWLFLLRPEIFIPVWTTTVAGLGVGRWVSQPDLFWHLAWNWKIFLLFTGLSLISGAASIRCQLLAQEKTENGGYLSVLGNANVSSDRAGRLSWIILGLGLVMVIPAGWLALLTSAAIFLVWGLLYGRKPVNLMGSLTIEMVIHVMACTALFYLGFAASGAPLKGSLNLAAPYIIAFTGVSVLEVIIATAYRSKGTIKLNKLIITIMLAVATILAVITTIWGYSNGDPVISTTAVLTLPFYAVALYYHRELDVVRTSRYSILIFVIFVGARHPWLFVPIIIDFYLSRYYYRRRFGILHPAFHVEHE